MKKNLIPLLLCTTLMCSCGGNNVSNTDNKSNETISHDDISSSESKIEGQSDNSTTIEESSSEKIVESQSEGSQKEFRKFIDVDDELFMLPGEEYYLSKMAIEKLDNVKYELDNDDYATVDNTGKITAITNDDEIKATTNLTIYDDNYYQEIKISVVDYETFGSYKHSVDLGRLYHKKVIFFGDSITHNWAKYPSGNKPETQQDIEKAEAVTSLGYNYVPLLNKECEFTSLTNAAWSGGTMSYDPFSTERFVYKSFPGAIENNIENIKNADYFLVFYGTNDVTESYDIDNHDEMTKLDNKRHSIIQSMGYGINRIREINEDAIIIFLNVLYRGTGEVDQRVRELNEAYSNSMIEYRTKLIDVYSLINQSTMTTYLKDGLHPNDDGYKMICDYILNGQKEN